MRSQACHPSRDRGLDFKARDPPKSWTDLGSGWTSQPPFVEVWPGAGQGPPAWVSVPLGQVELSLKGISWFWTRAGVICLRKHPTGLA